MNGTITPINVMTLNLRFGLADDGENSWDNRKAAYPGLFSSIKPDFIGVQEANNFQTDELDGLLPGHGYIGKREPSPDTWQNNIIFHCRSWACLKHRHFFLSDTPDVQSKFSDSKWPRQCTMGLFEKEGAQLIIVNTHFDFKASVQEKSAQLIIDALRDFPQKIPTILTGDFNTSPDSRTYDIFIQNGFMDMLSGKHSSTYHGFTGRDLGGHVDWILYKGNINGIETRVVREPFEAFYPSDHFPVVATFHVLR